MAAAALQPSSSSLSLSITNPLVLYRALLATQRIRSDPAQHRLALELQNLYYRLKDYDPEIEYRWRLEKAARLTKQAANKTKTRESQAKKDHKAVFNDGQRFSMSSLFAAGPSARMLALTRTIPVHSSAMEIDSPQGLLLYGEVGRGKSMLLDLLYSSLPTKKKRRWHFNTFILDVFRRLELARIERASSRHGVALEHEHVVLGLARETMEVSPILFLDEFQMPDRVSAKLVNGFLTSFFSLGGVLVASSNRMPEELAKASGVDFGRIGASQRWGRGGPIWEKLSIGQQQARNDFGSFVEVLKKRCEVWEMEGEKDWRREDGEPLPADLEKLEEEALAMDKEEAVSVLDNLSESSLSPTQSLTSSAALGTASTDTADTPQHYYLTDPESPSSTPSSGLSTVLVHLNPAQTWQPTTLTVYARPLSLSTTSPTYGLAILTFPELCQKNLGSADYISIASHFHTLVVTQVPILTLLMKNEARRFITFLDACYEARCRLVIEGAAPPDRLFFPETRSRRGGANMLNEGDSIESEAFSEMYQDSTAPFRPNISSYVGVNETARRNQNEYSGSTKSIYNPSLRSVLADEDADFGPTYGNRRSSSGVSSSAVDYDDGGAALDERDGRQEVRVSRGDGLHPGMAELELRQGPDFTQGAGVFTGQDEQFAYKRARSRLWEMCGRRWWREREGDPAGWWTPVIGEGRFWEKSASKIATRIVKNSGEGMGVSVEVAVDSSHDGGKRKGDAWLDQMGKEKEDALFRHGASPFRTSAEPPPKFGWQHAWGMMTWGKKAGEWGKGVEGRRKKSNGEESEK